MAANKSKKAAPNPIVDLVKSAKIIAEQKNLEFDDVIDCIERAIVTSLKSLFMRGKKTDINGVLTCKINCENYTMDVCLCKKVVDEYFDPYKHILLNKAQFYAPDCKPGDIVYVPLEVENYVDNIPADENNPDDPANLYQYEPLDPEDAFFEYADKKVVEEMNNPDLTILLEEAWEYNPSALLGDYITIHLSRNDYEFYQIAHKCKNIMVQNLKELEQKVGFDAFDSQHGEIRSAQIVSVDNLGNAWVKVSGVEAALPRSRQIAGDNFMPGEYVKVLIGESYREREGALVYNVSRSHPDFVKALFKIEVPEIADGIVEIVSIARDPGSRTKIAVCSSTIDPVGACIGPNSSRINAVLSAIGGREKIDVIKFNDDITEFVKAALAPAEVIKVILDSEDAEKCIAVVPHEKVSLAIGKSGQNAKLATNLTNMHIEIWDADEHPGALLGDAAVEATGIEEDTDKNIVENNENQTDTAEIIEENDVISEEISDDEEIVFEGEKND